MKKLYGILAILICAQMGFAQFVKSNSANVDADAISGNYDSYNWVWMGRDSQDVTLNVDFSGVTNDLSSLTMGWKASRSTRTGQVDYIVVSNASITVSSGTVTFSVTNTAIPPDNTYQTELFGYTGAGTNLTRTLAQGIVDVRNSLYENDNLFTFPNTTGLVEYVRKDGDFDQFTGLSGTVGQTWIADGAGGGAWSSAAGDITGVTAGTGLTGGAISGVATVALDSASIASLALADSSIQNGDSNTNFVNDAGYLVTGGTGASTNLSDYNNDAGFGVGDFLANGTVPMTGNLNMDGNSLTNVGNVYGNGAGLTNVNAATIDDLALSSFNVADNLSVERQAMFITNVAGTVYYETEAIGGGDIRFLFGGEIRTLDCTTGTGVGGRARVALTAGTDEIPVGNFVIVTNDGANAILSASTAFPTGSFSSLGRVVLQSAATTLADGVLTMQRFSDDVTRSGGRGRLDYVAERVRAEGALWASGAQATVTDDEDGNITLAVSAGVVYQMHRQTFAGCSDPCEIIVLNDPDANYTTITNFNQITKDSTGASISNKRYFGVRIIGFASSGDDGVNRVFAQLPDGAYKSDDEAIGDSLGYDNNTIANMFKGGAFNIARVVVYTGDTGTRELEATQDKRGELLNAVGTGGGSASAQTFPDTTFRVYDDGDVTKEIAFQASGITTATTRTLTVPDASGTIVLQAGAGGDLNMGGQSITNANVVKAGSFEFTDGDATIDISTSGLNMFGPTSANGYVAIAADPTDSTAGAGIVAFRNDGNGGILYYTTTNSAGYHSFKTGGSAGTDMFTITPDGSVFTESATNTCTKQWYSASNRWAEVYVKGSVTNVVFTSPVM